MKKRAILFILILLVSAFSVAALEMTYEATENKVLNGDQAKYLLQITNNADKTKVVTFRTLAYDWDLDQNTMGLELSPGEKDTFEITYSPVLERNPGSYGISLILETNTDKIEKFLPVQIIEQHNIIVPKIKNPTIDPRKPHLLKVDLENVYHMDLEDLTLQITSGFLNIEEELSITKQTEEEFIFEVDLEDTTTEGDYMINFLAFDEDNTEYMNTNLEITVAKFSDLKEVIESHTGFLIFGETVTQTNDGNEVLKRIYFVETSAIAQKFTTFSPEPDFVEENGELKAAWTYTLNPGESITLDHKTNYGTPLIILIAVLAILIALYTLLKQPISVRKKVITLRNAKGEIGIMKVMITIKNKTKFPLKSIAVVDRVPKSIKTPTQFGPYKPESITKMGEGLRMSWSIPSLRGRQEKVITYKVSSAMNLEHKVRLPAAIARVRRGGRKFRVLSNSTHIKEL